MGPFTQALVVEVNCAGTIFLSFEDREQRKAVLGGVAPVLANSFQLERYKYSIEIRISSW